MDIEPEINLFEIRKDLRIRSSNFWIHRGQKKALSLFHRASKKVPAYKDYLRKNNIKSEIVKTWSDFQNVPIIDKKNYLQQYPFESLHWNGTLKRPLVYTSTSGSTGKPVYFTRSACLDWQYATILNEFIHNGKQRADDKTLVVVCFAMGIWIGGLITYQAYKLAADSLQLPVSIITPGINKQEIIKALINIAPNYNKTILVGYPPFIKEIIDDANTEGINLKKLKLRFHFAAEAISENFRDYISREARVDNSYCDYINIYGSADIGAMAYEGPAAILLKRLSLKNRKVFSVLFSDVTKTPTIAQYYPDHIQFESVNNRVVLSGNNSIPLIRYSIGDNGGVFSFEDQLITLKKHGISFLQEAKKAGIDKIFNELPFVYIYERSDLSTTLYGINIYPEMIREIFLEKKICHFFTGRFNLATKTDNSQNQYLEVNLELRRSRMVSSALKKEMLLRITNHLTKVSSEFKELQPKLYGKRTIRLVFWPRAHTKYFATNVKHRWVINNV